LRPFRPALLDEIKPDTNERVPRYVTFTNPSLLKGLTLFPRLAAEARSEPPDAEFLVVESRWSREDVLRAGIPLQGLAKVEFVSNR
jgi:hypothetical protein